MTGHLRVVMNHVGVACAGRMSVGLGGTRQRPSRQRDLREVVLVAVAALGLLAAAAPVSAQETVEYYGTDALGSVRAVFDQTGGVIARADYMPFGEEVSAPGPVPVERFTGQARDGEVGKDYFHARALAPGTGRFNAPDPISRIAGISTGSAVHRQEQHRAGVVSAQSCAGGRHPDPAPPVGAMVFRHSRVTTRAIFVLAVVMVSPSRAWAQDPSMTPPPQDLPVEVLVPPPPAVEMAAPSLPTGPGALQALRDGDGMALEVTPGARLRLPASAGTVFDRRWGVIAGADVRVSATFLAGSATAQYRARPGAAARRGVRAPWGRVRGESGRPGAAAGADRRRRSRGPAVDQPARRARHGRRARADARPRAGGQGRHGRVCRERHGRRHAAARRDDGQRRARPVDGRHRQRHGGRVHRGAAPAMTRHPDGARQSASRCAMDDRAGSAPRTRHVAPHVAPSTPHAARRLQCLAAMLCLALAAAGRVSAQETVEYDGTDALGSVRVVFDQSGGVIARADYLPFGEEVFAPGPMPAERFTGQARDGEVGLDYLRARMMQSRTARFASPDPITPDGQNPQRWNRYAYALASPLMYTDRSGKQAASCPAVLNPNPSADGHDAYILPCGEDTTGGGGLLAARGERSVFSWRLAVARIGDSA